MYGRHGKVCFAFERTGRCKFGDKCRYAHESGGHKVGHTAGRPASFERRDRGNNQRSGGHNSERASSTKTDAFSTTTLKAKLVEQLQSGALSTSHSDALVTLAVGRDRLDGLWKAFLIPEDASRPWELNSQTQILNFVNSGLHALHDDVFAPRFVRELGRPTGRGLPLLQDLLDFQYSVDAGNERKVASFQRGLVALVALLTMRRVAMASRHLEEANGIFAYIRTAHAQLCKTFCAQLTQLVERGSVEDRRLGSTDFLEACAGRKFVPLCFTQILLPFLRLLYVLGSMFSDLIYEDTFSGTVHELLRLLEEWTTGGSRDETLDTPLCIQLMKDEVARLIKMVHRGERSVQTGHLLRIKAQRAVAQGRSSRNSAAASWDVVQVRVPAHALLENGTIGPRHDNDRMNIRDIRLLPTTEECLSDAEPPLPGNFAFHPNAHWLTPGPERWIDTHFRLLREDLCGSLRKSLQDLAYRLAETRGDVATGRLRSADLDYNVYPVVGMGMQLLHTGNQQNTGEHNNRRPVRHGLGIEVSFPHPPTASTRANEKKGEGNTARQTFWTKTKRLSFQQMVALVSFSGGTLEVVFCQIVDREMDKLVQDISEITLQPFETDDLSMLERWQRAARDQQQSSMLLVEFNKTFFIGYEPVLRTLQFLVPDSMPFLEYLAPEERIADTQVPMTPPVYCLTPGFRFDLSAVFAVNPAYAPREGVQHGQLRLNPLDAASRKECEATLMNASTLERDQAKAIVHALSSRVACIQGLPGSGKSFIGTLITRIIVQAQVEPVLIVCYTNHALDQFLCHLLDAGITRLVRVGGQCKEPRLEQHNINQIPKEIQRFELRKHYEELDECAHRIKEALGAMGPTAPGKMAWKSLAWFLETNYPDHYDYFMECSDEQFGGDWKVVGCADILEYWLNGLDGVPRKSRRNRVVNQLLESPDVWKWSRNERRIGLEAWLDEIKADKVQALTEAQQSYRDTLKKLACVRDLADVKALSSAQIIGMTTTGVAKHHAKIAEVAPRVVVCEEAGEVLEAQLMACLAPSCQQLILIGDHQQLRPHIADYNLSVESTIGKRFALDMSLFERLVSPESGIPWCTLTEQHRMRPEISQLVRMLFYPNVRDAHETTLYPPLLGVDKNVFFVTHGEPEDGMGSMDATGGLRSHSNSYEVAYVVATLHYLLKQGYRTDDIAILTPYVSQLLKLRSALQNQFVLEFNELDLEEIQRTTDGSDGDGDNDNAERGLVADISTSRSMPLGVSKTNLAGAIRIATVDNFQGEEANVILVSLVRSRSSKRGSQRAGTIGFLKIPNRVNVLLSRAKHGMILVGDGTLLRDKSPMWQQVASRLESDGCYGEGLPLVCQKHPDFHRVATSPAAFSQLSPDGGCLRPCGRRLPRCGHACPKLCHTDQPSHTTVFCSQPCPRLQKDCEHVCPRLCGEECGCCKVDVGTIQLPCGHDHPNTLCHQAKAPKKILCRTMCDKVVTTCGHTRRVACSTKTVVCAQVCSAALPCGHSCLRTCDECTKKTIAEATIERGEAAHDLPVIPTKHGSCRKECGRTLPCSHHCKGICHGSAPCPPCREVCDVFRCDHGACTHPCNKPCAACTMACEWSCDHKGQCPLPCGAPCIRRLCNERCVLPLDCGHQCPSVCGEDCPDVAFCHECSSQNVTARVADLIMFQSYGEVDPSEDPVLILDCCSAVYTISTLDGTLQLSDFYDENGWPRGPLPGEYMKMPQCPNCKRPIRGLRRYGRLTNRAAVDAAEKKFITEAQRCLVRLQARVNAASDGGDALEDAALHRELREFGSSVEKPPCRKVYEACVAQLTKLRHGRPIDRSKLPMPNSMFPYRGYFYLLTGQLSLVRKSPSAARRGVKFARKSVKIFGQGNFTQQLREAQLLLAQALAVSAEQKLDETVESEEQRGQREHAISTLVEDGLALLSTLETSPQSFQTQHREDVRALRTRMETTLERARKASFYQSVTQAELLVIKVAMQTEFHGSGHWYRCVNGHSYSIGECGMPMEQTRCPECGAPVGGASHTPVQGTTRDEIMEQLIMEQLS